MLPPSSDEQRFQQLSAILAGQKNYFMTLFANRALTLFVFWSGLPLASNGLPSTHKSHLYNPFDFFSPATLCLVYHVFVHVKLFSVIKAATQCSPSSSCTWEHAFFF